MRLLPDNINESLGTVRLELSMCGPAAGAPNQTPTTSVLAASTPIRLTRQSKAPTDATPHAGFHSSSFLLGLTALLAAVLSMARHPFLATLLTLGAMALLLSAAAGICGLSSEVTAVQNIWKGEL
jgi:uncharacterized membrane protein